MDLHRSVLAQILSRLDHAPSICALSITCRSMAELTGACDWQRLCRLQWGITHSDPRKVRRMDADLIQGYSKIGVALDDSVVWEQRRKGNPWRNIYRDRTFGDEARCLPSSPVHFSRRLQRHASLCPSPCLRPETAGC